MTQFGEEMSHILQAYYGSPRGEDPQPIERAHARWSVASCLLLDRQRPNYFTLRERQVPRPSADAYLAALLTGGSQTYDHVLADLDFGGYAPWERRILQGQRQCFVVWGRTNSEGSKIFHPAGTVRKPNGTAAIYMRRELFERGVPHMAPIGYEWELIRLDFRILSGNPRLGDRLKLEMGKTGGLTGPWDKHQHDLLLRPGYDDDLWIQLARRAQRDFDEYCSDRPLYKDQEWFGRFTRQYELERQEGDAFRASLGSKPWMQECDAVMEPWQLALLLENYRGLAGTSDDPERRLLNEYFRQRPGRTRLLDWFTDYVSLRG